MITNGEGLDTARRCRARATLFGRGCVALHCKSTDAAGALWEQIKEGRDVQPLREVAGAGHAKLPITKEREP